MCESNNGTDLIDIVGPPPPIDVDDGGFDDDSDPKEKIQILILGDETNPEVRKLITQVNSTIVHFQDRVEVVVKKDKKSFINYIDALHRADSIGNVYLNAFVLNSDSSLNDTEAILCDFLDKDDIGNRTENYNTDICQGMMINSLVATVGEYEASPIEVHLGDAFPSLKFRPQRGDNLLSRVEALVARVKSGEV